MYRESVCVIISIHAPARGATIVGTSNTYQFEFQSTLPRGERLAILPPFLPCSSNFNPRSREGSDVGLPLTLPHATISIHAPARGATTEEYCKLPNKLISIHAPARGATDIFLPCRLLLVLFQSTLPRGERLPISELFTTATSFQSTLPRGERLIIPCIRLYNGYFNPRSREGSDGKVCRFVKSSSHFNPRSREGSDLDDPGYLSTSSKFQSTLPRGERLELQKFFSNDELISIHAPARGATTSDN